MREALIKKRFGVPALLLIAILLTAGIAVAALLVASFRFTTTTAEPLTFTKKDGLDIDYPGGSDDITVTATNENPDLGYGIFVNNTLVDYNNQVVSMSYGGDNLVASEPQADEDFNNDGDVVDAKYNIGTSVTADSPLEIVVTINTHIFAMPGEVEVTLDFHREHEYEQ